MKLIGRTPSAKFLSLFLPPPPPSLSLFSFFSYFPDNRLIQKKKRGKWKEKESIQLKANKNRSMSSAKTFLKLTISFRMLKLKIPAEKKGSLPSNFVYLTLRLRTFADKIISERFATFSSKSFYLMKNLKIPLHCFKPFSSCLFRFLAHTTSTLPVSSIFFSFLNSNHPLI